MSNYVDVKSLKEFIEDSEIADLLDNNQMSELFSKWYSLHKDNPYEPEMYDLINCLLDNNIDVYGNLSKVDYGISHSVFPPYSSESIKKLDRIIFNNTRFTSDINLWLTYDSLNSVEFNDCSIDTKYITTQARVILKDCKFKNNYICKGLINGADSVKLDSSKYIYKVSPKFYLHLDEISPDRIIIKKGTSIEAPKMFIEMLKQNAKVI